MIEYCGWIKLKRSPPSKCTFFFHHLHCIHENSTKISGIYIHSKYRRRKYERKFLKPLVAVYGIMYGMLPGSAKYIFQTLSITGVQC